MESRAGASACELLYGRAIRDGLWPVAPTRPTEQQRAAVGTLQSSRERAVSDQCARRGARLPQRFQPGQEVRLQDTSTKRWTLKGKIMGAASVKGRSFWVRTEDSAELRRNERFIRPEQD